MFRPRGDGEVRQPLLSSHAAALPPLLPTHAASHARSPPPHARAAAAVPPHAVAVAIGPPAGHTGARGGGGNAHAPSAALPPALLAPRRGGWLRVDAAGRLDAFSADRHTVSSRYGVPARDLRLLDPALTGTRCVASMRAALTLRCAARRCARAAAASRRAAPGMTRRRRHLAPPACVRARCVRAGCCMTQRGRVCGAAVPRARADREHGALPRHRDVARGAGARRRVRSRRRSGDVSR
jgi:hypothetical protein